MQTKGLQSYKPTKFTKIEDGPRASSSIAILAESDQVTLKIVDCQLRKPVTLLHSVIESLIVLHLKDLIHICTETKDQDSIRTSKVINLNFK